MQKLGAAGVLAPDVVTVAYSYIGPEQTWRIYKDGTIGQAKKHLEESCACIADALGASGGSAYVSVNKAVVTQASSAIPVVPLYISLLFKKMKELDIHEDCIEQIERLFSDHLGSDTGPELDEFGRIRIDDWEMRDDVQDHIAELWEKVDTDNLPEIGDIDGYRENFLKLFGFGLEGVDYDADVDPAVEIPSLA
jgi:enoyl-[acyl-carrier protein] reductase/trans-2-enoyl-CoA reductase (NAD+)